MKLSRAEFLLHVNINERGRYFLKLLLSRRHSDNLKRKKQAPPREMHTLPWLADWGSAYDE
jgi:hypothetical protein